MHPDIKSALDLPRFVGQEIGVSPWVAFTQEQVDQFSRITLDPDPMHIDPVWCEQNSPFGGTIAFGFLTLSMLTYFSHQIYTWAHDSSAEEEGYALNYGLDRVRFVAPVPVGRHVRARMTLLSCEERAEGEWLQKFEVVVEIENEVRPALVAEWLGLWVRGAAHERIRGSFHGEDASLPPTAE